MCAENYPDEPGRLPDGDDAIKWGDPKTFGDGSKVCDVWNHHEHVGSLHVIHHPYMSELWWSGMNIWFGHSITGPREEILAEFDRAIKNKPADLIMEMML